jgi:hypothetical protein
MRRLILSIFLSAIGLAMSIASAGAVTIGPTP